MALVVGVGNPDRCDDGAGTEVARRVAELAIPGVSVVCRGDPLSIVEDVDGHDDVVIVDAMAPNGRPGRVQVWCDGEAQTASAQVTGSTLGSHGFGVEDALRLVDALGRSPRRLTIVGIEAASVDHGSDLSAPVLSAIDTAVDAVVAAALAADRPGHSAP